MKMPSMYQMMKAAPVVFYGEPLFNPLGWLPHYPPEDEKVEYAYLEGRLYLFRMKEHPDVRMMAYGGSPLDAWMKIKPIFGRKEK